MKDSIDVMMTLPLGVFRGVVCCEWGGFSKFPNAFPLQPSFLSVVASSFPCHPNGRASHATQILHPLTHFCHILIHSIGHTLHENMPPKKAKKPGSAASSSGKKGKPSSKSPQAVLDPIEMAQIEVHMSVGGFLSQSF